MGLPPGWQMHEESSRLAIGPGQVGGQRQNRSRADDSPAPYFDSRHPAATPTGANVQQGFRIRLPPGWQLYEEITQLLIAVLRELRRSRQAPARPRPNDLPRKPHP